MIKSGLKLLMKLGAALVLVYFVMMSGQLHRMVLRTYVGNHIVQVFGDGNMGTGFVLNHNGYSYVLTNRHVCEGSENGTLGIYNRELGISETKIIKMSDDSMDLCLLGNSLTQRGGLKVANSVHNGQEIAALGHPKGWPLTLTRGTIIGKTVARIPVYVLHPESCPIGGFRYDIFTCIVSTTSTVSDVRILPSSSGSPVVDFFGRVVGVVFAIEDGWTHIMSLEQVNTFLESI